MGGVGDMGDIGGMYGMGGTKGNCGKGGLELASCCWIRLALTGSGWCWLGVPGVKLRCGWCVAGVWLVCGWLWLALAGSDWLWLNVAGVA
eukprot:4320462-Lingulodinium_polyedra.AAC.1